MLVLGDASSYSLNFLILCVSDMLIASKILPSKFSLQIEDVGRYE